MRDSMKALEEMNVDEFMEGFGGSGSEEEEEDEEDEDEEEEEEDDRGEEEEEISDSEDDEANEGEEEDGSDEESDEEIASMKGSLKSHKSDLEALAKDDPEFFKYLQESDPKLLEFEVGDEVCQ